MGALKPVEARRMAAGRAEPDLGMAGSAVHSHPDHSVTFAYLRDTLCRGFTVFDSAPAVDEVFRDLALADH